LNTNIPPIECYIRKEYLYNFQKGHDELVVGTAFSVKSIQGHALLFQVMTDIGAVYDKVPISALVPFDQPKAKHLPFHVLQLWDCFSYNIECIQYMFLKGKRCMVMLKNGERKEGIYRFTFDWNGDGSKMLPTGFSEEPSQHKSCHIIELYDGYFCGYPNNRILWNEPSMVEKPFEIIPDYKVNMQKFHCESHDKWVTLDQEGSEDNYFYEIKQI
jgi:hypothetical protein